MDITLTSGQFDLVYNSFSFVIASMGAALLFFLLARSKIAPHHPMAVTLSTLVVAIAFYQYMRIFNSFTDAFTFVGGKYVQQGAPFNEGYRYVDWMLTVTPAARRAGRSVETGPGPAPSGASPAGSPSSTSCSCSSSSSASPWTVRARPCAR